MMVSYIRIVTKDRGGFTVLEYSCNACQSILVGWHKYWKGRNYYDQSIDGLHKYGLATLGSF